MSHEPPPVTCREFVGFLSEYLDGSMPGPQRAAFERHLGLCKSCADYLEGYRQTIRLGKVAMAASDQPVDPSVPSGLVKAVLAARPKKSTGA